jgi:hypothetical protein
MVGCLGITKSAEIKAILANKMGIREKAYLKKENSPYMYYLFDSEADGYIDTLMNFLDENNLKSEYGCITIFDYVEEEKRGEPWKFGIYVSKSLANPIEAIGIHDI